MILGIDVSCRYLGYSILNSDGTLVICDTLKLQSFNSRIKKVEYMEEEFQKIKKNYKIEHVFIEENLRYCKKSTANELDLLGKINALTEYICFKIFNVQPILLNCLVARSTCGFKRDKPKLIKNNVVEFLNANYLEFELFGKTILKKKATFFDMADSYVIAKAGFLLFLLK